MDWERLKADLGKGLKKGTVIVKNGSLAVNERSTGTSEEGDRQRKIMSFEARIHGALADLGARVYVLLGSRVNNPAEDAVVRDIEAQIRRYDAAIAALEKKTGKTSPRKTGRAA